jgi:hypothetical protein
MRSLAVVSLLCYAVSFLSAQEQIWSISFGGGIKVLQMKAVNDDNQSDVEGFNAAGIPIGPFPKLSTAPSLSGKVVYRFDREIGAMATVHYFSKEIETRFDNPDEYLHLVRSVSSTDLLGALVYYPRFQFETIEWYVELQLGLTLARAAARALGERNTKIDGQANVVKTFDSDATYAKSKLAVGLALGATLPLTHRVFVRGDASYKFAKVGTMEGTIRRFDTTIQQESTIEFDYSNLLFSLGIGMSF